MASPVAFNSCLIAPTRPLANEVRIMSIRSLIPRLIAVSLVGALVGCGGSEPVAPTPKRMVYVDTATMQPLVHDVVTSFPAKHPQTGKPTLRPALFCPTCQKWYPAPPPEEINRVPGGGKCPKDKSTLIADGPWPDGSGQPTKAAK
jgi:hypothetical protein